MMLIDDCHSESLRIRIQLQSLSRTQKTCTEYCNCFLSVHRRRRHIELSSAPFYNHETNTYNINLHLLLVLLLRAHHLFLHVTVTCKTSNFHTQRRAPFCTANVSLSRRKEMQIVCAINIRKSHLFQFIIPKQFGLHVRSLETPSIMLIQKEKHKSKRSSSMQQQQKQLFALHPYVGPRMSAKRARSR